MIHSLSGGVVRQKRYIDFAKVQLEDGGIYWYITELVGLQAGDKVLVPVGRNDDAAQAVVLRVDKNVNEQVAPVSVKHAKKIIKKI